MTSRVQKGGPIFRPVAKSRGPRQASVVSESPAIPSLAVGPSRSQSVVILPPATPSAPTSSSGTSTLKPTPLNQPSSEPPTAPTPIQAPQPPSIISSRTGTPINTPQPRPPVLASHTNVIPTLGSPITIAPGNTSRGPAKPIPIPNPSSQLDNSHRHEGTLISTPASRPPSSNHPPQIAGPSQAHIHTPANTLVSSTITIGMSSEQATMVSHTVTPTPTNGTEPSSSIQTPAPKPTKKRKRTPRSTPAATDEDAQDENEPSSGSGKRKRRASSTPRSRRSRGSSLPPFDPNADPGEDLDPTAVTMASLCEDTGQGRVSSKAVEILTNHVAWKAANRIKRARMRALMEAKKYGREEEFERESARESGSSSQSPDKGDSSPAVPGTADKSPANDASGIASSSNRNSPAVNPTGNEESGGFDYSQDLETNRFNVQVRIGPNGETIIDESTLEVDRTEPEDTTNYTHVVESDQTKFVNSGTYSKRYRGSRWSAEETEMFYHALSQYGENYELIAYVLPGRDRKSCKNKFKAEDKKNPARINYCLRNSTPVDMETLSKMTGKDFSGPVPEIRARPVPQLVPTEGAGSGSGNNEPRDVSPPAETSRKKNRAVKKASQGDDGVLVLGDADHFDPAFE